MLQEQSKALADIPSQMFKLVLLLFNKPAFSYWRSYLAAGAGIEWAGQLLPQFLHARTSSIVAGRNSGDACTFSDAVAGFDHKDAIVLFCVHPAHY